MVDPERPHFVETMEPVEINEGDALLLRCRVEGSPRISVAWFKAGGKLRQSNLCSLDFTEGVATLKLSKTTKFDRGEYVCKAENHIGSASASCHVMVKGDCPSLSRLNCMWQIIGLRPNYHLPGLITLHCILALPPSS